MKQIHYGWLIVASAFLTLMITNGPVIGAGLTIFDQKLLAEFAWSRGQLEFRDFLTLIIAGVAAPFIGAIADRYGVRRLMLAGTLLLAGGLLLYSRMQSLTHLYIIHAVFGLALACAGLVVCMMLVSRWFVRLRGTAIGLTLVGTSAGSILFPKLNGMLLAQSSWRDAFFVLGLLALALVPIILFVVREWPSDRGAEPYGSSQSAAASPPAGPAAPGGMSYEEALRTREFWTLAVIAMTTFYTAVAVLKHLFLYLTDQGLPPGAAINRIVMVAAIMLVGKFLLGWLADIFPPRRVLAAGLIAMLAGAVGLASLELSLFWLFAIGFGLGWGGLYTMIQLLIMSRFGLKASGKILGTITVLDAFGGGLGPWLTGVLHDRTGSYQLAFFVITGLIAAAFVLSLSLKDAPRSTPATGS